MGGSVVGLAAMWVALGAAGAPQQVHTIPVPFASDWVLCDAQLVVRGTAEIVTSYLWEVGAGVGDGQTATTTQGYTFAMVKAGDQRTLEVRSAYSNRFVIHGGFCDGTFEGTTLNRKSLDGDLLGGSPDEVDLGATYDGFVDVTVRVCAPEDPLGSIMAMEPLLDAAVAGVPGSDVTFKEMDTFGSVAAGTFLITRYSQSVRKAGEHLAKALAKRKPTLTYTDRHLDLSVCDVFKRYAVESGTFTRKTHGSNADGTTRLTAEETVWFTNWGNTQKTVGHQVTWVGDDKVERWSETLVEGETTYVVDLVGGAVVGSHKRVSPAAMGDGLAEAYARIGDPYTFQILMLKAMKMKKAGTKTVAGLPCEVWTGGGSLSQCIHVPTAIQLESRADMGGVGADIEVTSLTVALQDPKVFDLPVPKSSIPMLGP